MNNVEVSVTHEIKIGREKAWVKVGVNMDVPTGSNISDTTDEASDLVNEKVMQVIEDTVTTVENYEGDNK